VLQLSYQKQKDVKKMQVVTVKIETALISWNEIAEFCFSRDSNRYSRTKKRQQAFIKHELANQLPQENVFGKRPTKVVYEWHTSGKFDLGNLAAGEKFIADSFNEFGLWDDDAYTAEIVHKYIRDDEDYCQVTVSTTNPPRNLKKGVRKHVKKSKHWKTRA
jgi:Holliday junction resolvase RusA-like endonuclease